MAKINLEYSLKSCDEDIQKKLDGIFTENRIVYSDEGIKNVIKFQNPLYLSRENEEYKFEFEFDKNKITKGTYYLKGYNIKMDIDITTYELKVTDELISVRYTLVIDGEKLGLFEYKLKYEIL